MPTRIKTYRLSSIRLTSLTVTFLVLLALLAPGVSGAVPLAQAQRGGALFLPGVYAPAGTGGATVQQVVPNQYIVVLKGAAAGNNGVSVAAVDEVLGVAEQHGARVLHKYDSALSGFAAHLPPAALKALQSNPNVAYIEPDQIIEGAAAQTNATWGLDRIDQRSLPLDLSYTYNSDGRGVHAYIIDSGVRSTHSEFAGRMGNGFTAIADGYGTEDCHGHGTHVAGTVGGTTYGVAKQVTIHPVRVLNCQNSGTSSGVIAGIDWVTRNRVLPAVANMSLGGGASTTVDNALRNSIAAGVVYAVAAMNNGADACRYSPARVAEALAVGAVGSNDARASWSNYGSCLDLFAPGVSIASAYYTSDTAAASWSGTSMASPHVAGVAALYLAANPSAGPTQVAAALLNDATADLLVSSSLGAGSPNRLLYTGMVGEAPPATSTPVATNIPAPTPVATATPAPTATPTATPAPLPTATPTPAPVACAELLVDGSFEAGSTSWQQSSGRSFPLICTETNCPVGLAPHSGQALSWLGGANTENSRLSQTLTVPAGKAATLTYWYRVESEDSCGYDKGYVQVLQGKALKTMRTFTLCATNNTGGWRQDTLDLSRFAGKQVRLDFYTATDSRNVSNFFVDDASLRSGSSCTAAAGTATVAGVEEPEDTPFVESEPAPRAEEPAVGEIQWRR